MNKCFYKKFELTDKNNTKKFQVEKMKIEFTEKVILNAYEN